MEVAMVDLGKKRFGAHVTWELISEEHSYILSSPALLHDTIIHIN